MTSLPVPTRRRKIPKTTLSLALTDPQDTGSIQDGRRIFVFLHIVISVQANYLSPADNHFKPGIYFTHAITFCVFLTVIFFIDPVPWRFLASRSSGISQVENRQSWKRFLAFLFPEALEYKPGRLFNSG